MTVRRILSIFLVLGVIISLFGCTPSQNEPGETDKSFELDEELIAELTEYFTRQKPEGASQIITLGVQLSALRNGRQAFVVKSNPEDYYFACAYYSGEHDRESIDHCCRDSYIWVGFNNANSIKEYYQDKKFVAAFQVNNSLMCENILLENGGNSTMIIYEKFNVKFENGTNTLDAKSNDRLFFYFNDELKDVYYFSTKFDDINPNTDYCMEFDGEYYFIACIGQIDAESQTLSYDSLKLYLYPLYEELDDIMVTDMYSEERASGTLYFALFKVKDVVSIIKN